MLIHCRHGVSRSATVTVAYVMADQHLPMQKGFDLVQSKRPRISPNQGFLDQLKKFEETMIPET